MPHIFVPPHVARELRENTRSFREDVWRSLDLTPDPQLHDLALTLQRIDRRLLLVRARESVVPGVPMRPGYYHLLIDNGPHSAIPISVTVIEGEQGEFVYPTWRVIERLHAGDVTDRRNLERWERRRREEYEANEREKVRDREERQEHLKDLVNAYTRTSVSTTRARPWTQNTQPNANREAGQRKKDQS